MPTEKDPTKPLLVIEPDNYDTTSEQYLGNPNLKKAKRCSELYKETSI